MKKFIVGCAMLVGLGSAALAADMPLKALPPVVPVYNWTGFYIGGEVGGLFGRTQVIHGPNDPINGTPNVPITSPFDTSAALGGVTVGYNYQINQAVLGIEGDYAASTGAARTFDISPFNTAFSHQVEQRSFATIRGRGGFLVVPNLLVYGTAGYAASDVRQTVFPPPGVTPIAESHVMSGWTAGFGIEWKFLANWSAKAEYLFADLGRKSFFNPASNPTFLNDAQVRLRNDVVRFGVNYQFGGPVVAKY